MPKLKNKTHTVAICNQKGGVAKTTVTINLGAALAKLGKKVLIVDADPQSHATKGIGIDPYGLKNNLHSIFTASLPPTACIHNTSIANLKIIPCTIDLCNADIEFVHTFDRFTKMDKIFQEIGKLFDFILIDCPPSLGTLSINALVASTDIIIPMMPEPYAVDGMQALQKTVIDIRNQTQKNLSLLGVVITMARLQENVHRGFIQNIQEYWGDKVFNTIIEKATHIVESAAYQRPVVQHIEQSKASNQFYALAKEVIDRTTPIRKRKPQAVQAQIISDGEEEHQEMEQSESYVTQEPLDTSTESLLTVRN